MRDSNLLIFLLIISIFSCKSKTNSATLENLNDGQTYRDTTNSLGLDSLDIDTSSFIVTNFPDTAREVLYANNHKLFKYVLRAYNSIKNQDTLFSIASLKQLTLSDNFSVDSSDNEIILWRHSFNKREQIEYSKNKKEIKVLIANQLWYKGKKYQLIWLRLLPFKKNDTVFDNF